MISITVCLHSARTNKTTVLGQTFICNDGSGTPAKSNYDVYVGRKPDAVNLDTAKILEKPLRKGRVENYNAPAYNMWRLVIRALKNAFPEEN